MASVQRIEALDKVRRTSARLHPFRDGALDALWSRST